MEKAAAFTKRAPIVIRENIANTVYDRQFSIAKSTREIGYIPSVEFSSGIKETIEWFKNNE